MKVPDGPKRIQSGPPPRYAANTAASSSGSSSAQSSAASSSWVAPQSGAAWYDDLPLERRVALPAGSGFGAFLPTGERLRGWHFVDGSAAKHGLGDRFADADVDIASLFALRSTRGALAAADLAVLSAPVKAPVMGRLEGALLTQLPLDVARRELRALVDDDVIADFWASHEAPGPHADPREEAALDRALQRQLHQMVQARGLAGPRVDAALARGAPRHASDDGLRAVIREQFIDSLLDLLDRDFPSRGVIDEALVGRAFHEDATRLVRLLSLRAREHERHAPPPALTTLLERAAEASAQPLRRTLAEALLAASAAGSPGVTAAVARVRGPAPDAFVAALLHEVKDLPSWRRRDVDAAVAEGLSRLLTRHARGGVVDANALAAATSESALDVVLALLRGAASPGSFRGGPAGLGAPADRGLLNALEALADPGGTRASAIAAREDAAERLDEWRAQQNGGGFTPFIQPPPTAAEQEDVANGTRVSLAALSATLARRPPAVLALLPIVRARDLQALFAATKTFPPLMDGKKNVAFFDAMERALDAQGGGAPALDAAAFPRAVLEVLSPLADARGVVAWRDVREAYGSAAATWFALVGEAVNAGALGDAAPEQALTHAPSGLSEVALGAIGRGLPDISFRARMGGLQALTQQQSPQALAGFDVVMTQHLFPTTMGLVDALMGLGLAPDKLHVLGKSYSTHERTYAALRAAGLDVDASARQDNNLAEDANTRLAGAARRTLQKLFAGVSAAERDDKSSKPRFILFDEGGKLLEVLHKEFAAYAHLAIGVEHTDRGMQQLDQMEAQGQALALPVVDMARSMAKKTFESPAIGESVVFHAEELLRELDVQPRHKQAAVIGYGAVGKATADALRRRGYQVAVHDTDPGALARARADGCLVTDGDEATRRRAALKDAHLLVSATGRTTIEPKEFAELLPDGAILVNAASGTHEFGIGALGDDALTAATRPEALREDGVATTTFGGRSVATGAYTTSGKHRHLVFAGTKADGSEVEHLVLRGGAVVNMTLGMPPEVVQLTLGLVMASMLQAAALAQAPRTTPTRHRLDETQQRALIEAVENDLKARGLPTLSQPDFRAVAPWG